MSVEEKAASIISKVGLWWPLAEEDQLRQAAAAYEQVATAVMTAAATGTAGARLVSGGDNRGQAIDAFGKHWANYDGTCSAGLPATAQAASNVAAALEAFAVEVDDAKRKIINLAIEIGATIAAGVGLAVFTFGGSAAAAAARTAMLVAKGWLIANGLSAVAATIVTTMLAGATFGAVEGFVSSIVAQMGKIVLSDGQGISLGEAATWAGFGAAGGTFAAALGHAGRTAYRALRNPRTSLGARFRAIDWADQTGSVALGRGRPPRFVREVNGKGIRADMYNGDLYLLIEKGPGTPSGRDMFDSAVAHYGRHNIRRIQGNWELDLPTNLDQFNALTRSGLSPEDAARATWTGRMADRHGFPGVTISKLGGDPGDYRFVELWFHE